MSAKMSTPSVIGMAVSPVVAQPSTPPNKRRTSPSAEVSSSKQTLVLTSPSRRPPNVSLGVEFSLQPFFPPRQLFPRGVAKVAHQYTHAHPSAESREEKRAIWQNRHVLLPFNLRDSNLAISGSDVHRLLHNIFPGTTNVTEGRYRSHLLFQVKELPSSPWPLTIGGVPITIIDESGRGRPLMFPWQNLGNLNISICRASYGDVRVLSDTVLRKLAADVNAEFQKNLPSVRIIELMFTCERTFYVVVDDHIQIGAIRGSLPGRIANCPVGYLNNNELHRPLWADLPAKRQVEPQPKMGIIDSTAYDILRPGVMICSKLLKENSHPAVFSTTSGVLVQNAAGDNFMTGASHGIGDQGTVWQANRSDKIIGKAVAEISFTDVSLLELGKDVRFVNATFENSSGVTPNWSRLVNSDDILDWPICYLNSPYTGNMEGIIVMKSVKLEASTHPTQDKLRYVVYNWSFMGQQEDNDGRAQPPDGTCGSVIWDDDGVILGFYHYYIAEGRWAGFSPSVSASEVVEAGYTLAE
ncbi:hypothetical protein DL769_007132 [Monosporascus sp. CRB-8-3]|nr:hypothetical protein DL769_007132 [Monosporascus sp. CRB-8-3]